jgi:hypothetical protein
MSYVPQIQTFSVCLFSFQTHLPDFHRPPCQARGMDLRKMNKDGRRENPGAVAGRMAAGGNGIADAGESRSGAGGKTALGSPMTRHTR